MRVPPHLVRLYIKTSRRYKKLISKIHRESVTGYQRETLLHQVKKLLKRLRDLQAQLKIAAATGTVALILQTAPARAQADNPSTLGPFVKQDRINNPLREPIFTGMEPAIAALDFDKDDDIDIVVGEYNYSGGELRYFENRSTQGHPVYIELTDDDNPFAGIQALTRKAVPAFADIDQDGDLDLFLGQSGYLVSDPYGYINKGIEYYRNDDGVYTKQDAAWNATTKEGNPLEGIQLGYDISPVLIDFDGDNDIDLVAGSHVPGATYPYYGTFIHYYVNDGEGNFSASAITLDNQPTGYYNQSIFPALADIDEDGDYDMVVGTYYDGFLRYYRQDTPGNFVEETEEWDPVAKTGNPFYNFDVGRNASPVFADFDNDGEADLFLADEKDYYGYGYKYSDNIINYYHNEGDGSFVQKEEFENPFGGVFVKAAAAPVLMDVDGDNDLDAVIGNKYQGSVYDPDLGYYISINSYLTYYQKNSEGFVKIEGENDPYDSLEIFWNFTPQFADADGDNDLDLISGNYYGEVVFFRNEEGEYIEDAEMSPFAGISHPYYGVPKLVDLDNDQDLDLVLANYSNALLYFRNTGTAQEPVYEEMIDTENPFQLVGNLIYATGWSEDIPYINFTDLDHDGDMDLLFNGADPLDIESRAFVYFENTGTPESPLFESANADIFAGLGEGARISVVDYDNDGDLDAFAGYEDGTVSYFENQNQALNTTVTETVVVYDSDGDAVAVEPALTLVDPDDDTIILATVAIQNYQAGEILKYSPHPEISGVFDAGTGVLTLRGKNSANDYQSVLRSVTFEVGPSGGRKRPARKTLVEKTISFAVYDEDFTNPTIAEKRLDIFINDPPTITTQSVNVSTGNSVTVDLKQIIADPNGSADLDISSLKVTQPPPSGAVTSINSNGILTIDYTGLEFTGMETLTVEVCDVDGACAQNTLSVTVTNTPPVIEPEPVSAPAGTVKSINLMTITSDVDNNLDPDGFSIVEGPSSGAQASIAVLSPTVVNLELNYNNITFEGTDQLTIRACDRAGACSDNVLAIAVDVESKIVIHNAVAPNSSGDNRFMRILGLPENNKVRIYNRWGDKVYDVENYQNDPAANAFRGLNNNGNALSSGTYFYTIEVPEQKMITGYLTLKQ